MIYRLQDFKKTLKVTWLPADLKTGRNVPLKCLFYDHVISKAVLGKDEEWRDFVNRDYKVRISSSSTITYM